MRKLALAAGAAAVFLIGVPSHADVVVQNSDWTNTPYRVVHFHDLNLQSQTGLDTLNQRIRVAVYQVCGPADIRMLREFSAIQTCRRDSLYRAHADRDAMLAARADSTSLAMADLRILRVKH
ncbi:UrcA family protein [Novosphingobium mangrovi (ex Huang et al. 2023)]|uniref:UrcA family protein n=1 Tax=Novosphingobium mangrovi (ex Huang et al. 2023) TaxID=2976432 RepID=A0ABT2I4V5_9SPHN|nr:UrcA family protein [Novosphingobium mangrovi (ex Huang et al. 2023)]MCT2399843.1 UrcA family protein [Novosphingobium mangrovi (ex Huang et al. 2023)]